MSRIRANTITNQNANGAPNFPDGITVTGIVTATTTSQNITGDLTVTGNVGIAGTLTYEDVKNVDSVGIVTARSGIRVTSTTDGIAVGTNAMVSGRADNVLHLHKASGGTADGPTIYFTNQQTGVTGSDGFIGSQTYKEVSSGKFHDNWFEELEKNNEKIPEETMRLLKIQKEMMIKQLIQYPELYYTKSHFPLEISQRAFDHLWRMCESYELWCKETNQKKLILLNLTD